MTFTALQSLYVWWESVKKVLEVWMCVNRFINSLFLIPALTSAGQLFVVWQGALKRSPGLESPLTSPLPILSHRETGEPEPPKCQEVFNAASVTCTKPRRSRDEEQRVPVEASRWLCHATAGITIMSHMGRVGLMVTSVARQMHNNSLIKCYCFFCNKRLTTTCVLVL